MAIKFGLPTNPASNILEEINAIKKIGFDYVELCIELPEGAPEIIIENKQKILKLFQKFDSKPLAHTAWWIDFGTGYEPVRRGWVQEAKRSIDAVKVLGIKIINFHFYSIGLTKAYKRYHKQIITNIIASLREVVNYANSKKMNVMLENSPTKKSVLGIKEYKLVIDNVPKLKVHLDIGHAFIENRMKGIRNYLLAFKNKLEHIHIHDNHGEEDEHLPLGKGEINFEQVAKWLKQIHYNKTMTFEVFTSKRDARESMIKFKKMLSE